MINVIELLTHRGHAQLIQELERSWPGCKAHTKRNQATGVYDIVWSDLLPRDMSLKIGAYVDGWRECLKFAIKTAQETSPFTDGSAPAAAPDPARGKRRERRRPPLSASSVNRESAARTARARLESLFKSPDGGES